MTHGKTYSKSPRRINHKATKSNTNTGTTALERSVEQTTGTSHTRTLMEEMKVCLLIEMDNLVIARCGAFL